MQVTAATEETINITLTGKFVKGYPERGPTYDCGGEPAEPDTIEDEDIESIHIERWSYNIDGGRVITVFDILAGLDNAAKAIISQNVLAAIGADTARQYLMDEVTVYDR